MTKKLTFITVLSFLLTITDLFACECDSAGDFLIVASKTGMEAWHQWR